MQRVDGLVVVVHPFLVGFEHDGAARIFVAEERQRVVDSRPEVAENAARGVRPARGSPRVGVSWQSMGFADPDGSIVSLKAADTPWR
jgi:hypothetical protein